MLIDVMQAVTWPVVAFSGVAGLTLVLVVLILAETFHNVIHGPEKRARAAAIAKGEGNTLPVMVAASLPAKNQSCDNDDNVTGYCPKNPGCVSRNECQRTLDEWGKQQQEGEKNPLTMPVLQSINPLNDPLNNCKG